MMSYEDYLAILKQAQKDGERAVTGYTGRTPTDALADLTTGLPAGEIWVRINGQADPYNALYEDPAVLQPNLPVKLTFDIEADAWVVKSVNASIAIYDGGGTTPPTFAVPVHDHTDTVNGGPLGADTVDTTNIVALAVTDAKLASNAVTTAKIADANVTLAKMATDSVDTANILNDAVTPTKTDGLTGASAALVAQTALDAFTQIPYTLTTGTRLYYDGTTIRAAFRHAENAGTAITGITTTPVTFATSPDMAALVDTSASVIKITHNFTWRGDTAGDVFNVVFEYNYDNAGVEAWQNVLTRWMSLYVWTANAATSVNLTSFFDASTATSPTWGFSGTYKLRATFYRASGTGNGTIFSTSVNQRINIWEEI